ncbi:MAG: long-chain fatty acid--CoA ligase, partial [Treponema sp.]|nr:long-chain fatty acid--CoA ligase [Treponema sp.]
MDKSFATVIELLRKGAEKYGNAPYLGGKTGDRWRLFSYRETDRLSDAFALALMQMGFGGHENISILSEGCPSWVIGEFGILKAGCTSVPLSTKLLGDEIVFRLDHSESRALLVSENNFQKGAEVLDKVRKKPALICITAKNGKTAELAEKFSLTEGTDLFYYDDLVRAGEKILDAGE